MQNSPGWMEGIQGKSDEEATYIRGSGNPA